MAQITSIADLKRTTQRPMLVVRVFKVWRAAYAGAANLFAMNFVLIDAKGGAIQGMVPIAVHDSIADVFAEGQICEASKFNIIPTRGGFQTVVHACNLCFGSFTRVRASDAPILGMPLYVLRPVPLRNIGVSVTATDALIDCVAKIVGFGDIQNVQARGMAAVVRHMYLTDESGTTIEVALWDEFVNRFDVAALAAESATRSLVVGCSSLQIRVVGCRYSCIFSQLFLCCCLCCMSAHVFPHAFVSSQRIIYVSYLHFPTVKYGLKTFPGTRFLLDRTMPELAAFESRCLHVAALFFPRFLWVIHSYVQH